MPTPRLRIFAGPNGSGKSTIKNILEPELIYLYVNADDLEREGASGSIDLSVFNLNLSEPDFHDFYSTHQLIINQGMVDQVNNFTLVNDVLWIDQITLNSYHASVIADFIRHQLLEAQASFTFETVMSDPSKVDFIKKARALGYRTYLYFVTTEDPEININRVAIRVDDGGHNVTPEKIRSRYDRCLALLPNAIQVTNRAYLFDNSGSEAVLEAEITEGAIVEYKIDEVHYWCFDAIDVLVDLANQP